MHGDSREVASRGGGFVEVGSAGRGGFSGGASPRDTRLPGFPARTWGAGTRLRCVVRAPPGPPCLVSQPFLSPGAADSFNGSCFGSLPSPSWKGPGPPLSLPASLVVVGTGGLARRSGENVPTCAGWTEPAPPVLACPAAPRLGPTPLISRTCGRAAAGRPASPFPKVHQYLLTFGLLP